MKRIMKQSQLDNLQKGKVTRFNSETARAAQKNAVQARMRNKALAEFATIVSDTRVTNEDMLESLREYGITDPVVQNEALIAIGVFREAIKGNIRAVNKWEKWLDEAEANREAEILRFEREKDWAVAQARARYSPNINSCFGNLSVCALKHLYTHYELSGGRGSSKSSWVSLTVVRLVMENPDVHALVLRKVAATLQDSVFDQYLWAVEKLGVSEYWEEQKTPLELTYTLTGQKILFRGADDPAKLKSIRPEFGYLGITHFEEKAEFGSRVQIDNILQSTMRGGEKFWNFETYNPPRSRDSWVNKASREEQNNRIRHHSTYLDLDDPEWLGEAFIHAAEELKARDEDRYRHEYLGIPVGNGGSVFEALELREITDEEIKGFRNLYQGVDWGWFPDPFAFIRLHYDRESERVYLLDEHYGTRITNRQSAEWILEQGYNDVFTVCDSAEKKSISDYRNLGIKVKEAEKGPGSIEHGLKWLQGRTFVIDKKRTPQAYEEFQSYEYETNRKGEWISGYPDRNNHTIDAVRYALERVSSKFRSNA